MTYLTSKNEDVIDLYRILLQMHLNQGHISLSMNEIYPMGSNDNTPILRNQTVARATSAYVKDLVQGYGPLSFNKHSESGYNQS